MAALPSNLDLSGKVAIVSGATSGIGLEISRQFLEYKVSTLILAVRDVSRGEAVKASLLEKGKSATIAVMHLDHEDLPSVQKFITNIEKTYSDLHILMLNAGINSSYKELTTADHNKVVQVNYLANAVLALGLMPLLKRTAERTGSPGRITFTGSRLYANTSLAAKAPLEPDESVLGHFAHSDKVPALSTYADSKLLCVLFVREAAERYDGKDVVVNSFSPGIVSTNLNNNLPLWLRMPISAMMAVKARSSEDAARAGLNAAVVVGVETHGKLLGDEDIEEPSAFVLSTEGQRIQRLLWEETAAEMERIVNAR